MKEFIVLHIANINFDKCAGLSSSIPSLIDAQNRLKDVRSALLLSSNYSVKHNIFNFQLFSIKDIDIDNFFNIIPAPFNKPNIVIFHSTYIPINAKIAKLLFNLNIPYIIVPRGGMTMGAQRKKRFKKYIGNLLFFNKFVKNAKAIHYLTENEAEQSKSFNKEYFIVPNGININKEVNNQQFDYSDKKINFVFIGRYDIYHKGLDLLIEACSIIKSTLKEANISIKLYGGYKKNSKKKLLKIVHKYDLQGIINVYDPVYDNDKSEVLKSTDVFIHTSRFEGHPMGVLEALSNGVPCLLTPGTNMSKEVSDANAGWEAEQKSESIANTLKLIIENPNDINIKKINTYDFVKRYSWEKIAEQSINEYHAVIQKDIN